MKRYLACKCDGVIAISSYLHDYYKGRGCNTVLLPPVGRTEADVEVEKKVMFIDNKNSYCVKFLYAGAILLERIIDRKSLKDRIDLTVEIISELHKKGLSFVFDVFGIDKEQYIMVFPDQKENVENLGEKVIFHGKKSNKIVCNYIKEADYTILNRIKTKETTAGFPSKISESLLMGTPVLTNATSDLKKYIINGRNGLIISFDVNRAASEIFALCDDKNRIKKMKRICCQECCFDYLRYIETLDKLMQDVISDYNAEKQSFDNVKGIK